MRVLLLLACLTLLVCVSFPTYSQDSTGVIDKISNFPLRFIDKINNESARLERQLTRQTQKYLRRLSKEENKLRKKLHKIDSLGATQLFENSQRQYEALSRSIGESSDSSGGRISGEYMPYIDSVKGSLSFLRQNQQLISPSADIKEKIQGSLSRFNRLQSKLQHTEQVKQFIRDRKEQIRQVLSRYSQLPRSITKSWENINKEIYYYSQTVREYRQLLNDPDRLTQKALSLLNRLPAWEAFMKEHSELAGLFTIPGNYGSAQALTGLQTRDQVMQLIQNQISSGGPNAQQYFNQQMQAAQTQLSKLKDKITQLGGGSGDIDMPSFRPNNQRSRSFLRRLEYSTNLQSTRSGYFFPTTTDLGLSVGYKLNDRSIIGVGASYKVGWGRDIRHIVITQQGAGIRSFIDYKIKSSFWLSGGYEQNYQTPSLPPPTGEAFPAWKQSGLIGLTKVVSLKSKLFKKTKIQVLFDFLYKNEWPRTEPIKFRVGYGL